MRVIIIKWCKNSLNFHILPGLWPTFGHRSITPIFFRRLRGLFTFNSPFSLTLTRRLYIMTGHVMSEKSVNGQNRNREIRQTYPWEDRPFPMERRFLLDKISRFVSRNVSSTQIVSLHHWTEIGECA